MRSRADSRLCGIFSVLAYCSSSQFRVGVLREVLPLPIRYRQFTLSSSRRQSIMWFWLNQLFTFLPSCGSSRLRAPRVRRGGGVLRLFHYGSKSRFLLRGYGACFRSRIHLLFARRFYSSPSPGRFRHGLAYRVPPDIIDICHYRQYITFSSYVNNESCKIELPAKKGAVIMTAPFAMR